MRYRPPQFVKFFTVLMVLLLIFPLSVIAAEPADSQDSTELDNPEHNGPELTWPDPDAEGWRRAEAPTIAPLENPDLPGEVLVPSSETEAPAITSSPPEQGAGDPLVAQVAASLNNDPLAIYNYVKTEIAFEPIYGLKRDPHRTILERTGTDSDQAALLVALLEAAGIDANYRFGTITLSLEQAAAMLRVEPGATVLDTCNRVSSPLGKGGIPADEFCLDGSTNEIRLQHVWVIAAIDGVTRNLDPSVKRYRRVVGIDLQAALGYDRSVFLSRAEAGATITADQISQLNAANINADLEQYAANLVAHLDATNPQAYLQDIAGGWVLDEAPVATLPEGLPYPSIAVADFAEFDQVGVPELRHKIAVQVIDAGTATIALNSTLADLAGRRLTYQYAGTIGVLRLEGVELGSHASTSTSETVQYCVDAPFPAFGGAYGDQCTNRVVVRQDGNTYAFVTENGRTPTEVLAERRALLAAAAETSPAESEAVLGEVLNLLGLIWYAEFGASDRLHEAIADVNGTSFRGMAVMFDKSGIDARLNMRGVYSPTLDRAATDAYFTATVAQSSGFEHGIFEQFQGIPSISTIRALQLANAAGLPIFQANTDNWSTVRPQLAYDAGTLAGFDAQIADGFALVVPQAPVTLNEWTGAGWIAARSGTLSYFIRGSVLGGSKTLDLPFFVTDNLVDPLISDRRISFVDGVGDPVHPQTGALTHTETDVRMAGGPPLGLGSFSRFYDSGTASEAGALGPGWNHSYDWALTQTSDYERGLGGPSAKEAALLVAQVFVLQDVLRNPDIPTHEQGLFQALTIDWGVGKLTNNALILRGPEGANGIFVALPGGSYSRSAKAPYDVVTHADGSITLEGRAGVSLRFEQVAGATDPPTWQMTTWTDSNGNTLTLSYDVGKLTQVQDTVGRTLTFTYSGERVASLSDPAGRTHAYGYDEAGRLVSHTDARGSTTSYTYDAQDRLLTITDPLGQTYLTNVYDAYGRVTEQTDGRGNVIRIFYGDHLTRVWDPLGQSMTVTWTDDRRYQTTTDEAGFTTAAEFDAHGNLVRLAQPEDVTSTFAYDGRDNLVVATDPLGNQTTFAYDGEERPTLVRSPLGHETHLTYDGSGNLTSVTNALGQVTRFAYDAAGRLTDVFEPGTDAHSQLGYDQYGNLATSTNAAGETTTYQSDIIGQLLQVTDPLGNSTAAAYDASGNLTGVTDPLGHALAFAYDANNMLTSETDPRGRTTQHTYDPQNNLTLTTRADGTTIGFAYDANNRLTSLTDPRGKVWRFELSPVGLITDEIDPLGNRHRYAYDGLRRLVQRIDARGLQTDYAWDAASRLTQTAYDNGTAVSNSYDAEGNLTASSYRDWNANYEYDALNRAVAATYPYLGRRVESTWDQFGSNVSVGDRAQLRFKVGDATQFTATYAYDLAHRLTELVDDAGATQYAYDAAGRLTGSTLPNGASIQHTYDQASRVLSVANADSAGSLLAQFDYTYDAANNVTGMTRVTPSSTTPTTYFYDNLDRLLGEDSADTSIGYTYDDAGNRLSRTEAGSTTTYTYDDANQLLTAGSTTYAYDANGNLVQRMTPEGTTTFEWDHENRLIKITPPRGPATTYAYDPFGRRILRQTAGQPDVHATYDGMQLLVEGPVDMAWGQVYGGGQRNVEHRHALHEDDLTIGYGVDRLGSATVLTNNEGQIGTAYRYDAFGREQPEQVRQQPSGGPDSAWPGDGPNTNPFHFGGGFGAESEAAGLVRMGFRFYDPEVGRFISRDPIGFFGGDVNLYGFVGNNPTTYADPDGLARDNPTVLNPRAYHPKLGYYNPQIYSPERAFWDSAEVWGTAVADAFYGILDSATSVPLGPAVGPSASITRVMRDAASESGIEAYIPDYDSEVYQSGEIPGAVIQTYVAGAAEIEAGVTLGVARSLSSPTVMNQLSSADVLALQQVAAKAQSTKVQRMAE